MRNVISKKTEQVYVCPRDTSVHRGRPEYCDRACERARNGNHLKYEDESYTDLAITEKKYAIDKKLCVVEL